MRVGYLKSARSCLIYLTRKQNRNQIVCEKSYCHHLMIRATSGGIKISLSCQEEFLKN